MSLFGTDAALPLVSETADFDETQVMLAAAQLSDGLPLAPPTARRLQAMLEGVAERDRSHGLLPPLYGDLTPRAVAYQCVLAGCIPAELPIVLTAAAACLEPAFNVLGLLTTTGTPAIATIVHGPIAAKLDMNAGTNCLGPGARSNAAIGRAVSLVMRNIGGAREGSGDMATMGQPGKYSFCSAEAPPTIYPGLAERQGLGEDVNAVTVLGVSGTVEVLPLDDRDTPESILTPMAAAMIATGAAASAGRARPPDQQVFLLPPELAAGVDKHGWSIGDMQTFLFETTSIEIPGVMSIQTAKPLAATPQGILPIITGGPGVKMTCLPLWAGGSAVQTRALKSLEDQNL